MATKEAKQVETVKMDDERVVEFAGAKKLIKESFIDEATGAVSVRLDFRNGETRTFTVPQKLLLKFAAHGAEQKLGDEISGVDKIEDCVEAIDLLMTRLSTGEWSKEREGGGGLAGASVLTKALVRYYDGQGITVEQIRGYLSGLDAKTKMALRNSAEIAPHVKAVEAEIAARAAERGKSAPTIDVGSVLAGLKTAPASTPFVGTPEGEPAPV